MVSYSEHSYAPLLFSFKYAELSFSLTIQRVTSSLALSKDYFYVIWTFILSPPTIMHWHPLRIFKSYFYSKENQYFFNHTSISTRQQPLCSSTRFTIALPLRIKIYRYVVPQSSLLCFFAGLPNLSCEKGYLWSFWSAAFLAPAHHWLRYSCKTIFLFLTPITYHLGTNRKVGLQFGVSACYRFNRLTPDIHFT